jgi:hypothetical protein
MQMHTKIKVREGPAPFPWPSFGANWSWSWICKPVACHCPASHYTASFLPMRLDARSGPARPGILRTREIVGLLLRGESRVLASAAHGELLPGGFGWCRAQEGLRLCMAVGSAGSRHRGGASAHSESGLGRLRPGRAFEFLAAATLRWSLPRPRAVQGSASGQFGGAASFYFMYFVHIQLRPIPSAILTDCPDCAAAFLKIPHLPAPASPHPARPARGRSGPQPVLGRLGSLDMTGPVLRQGT